MNAKPLLFVVTITLAASMAVAQTGDIRGSVTDAATGAPVVEATVTITETSSVAITAADGSYELVGVPVGSYTVSVIHRSYRPAARTGVEIVAGGNAAVDLRLEPTPVFQAETVVTANRIETPIDELGNTISVVSAETIEKKQYVNLDQTLREVPGVIVSGNGFGQDTYIRMRGFTNKHTLVLIDGVRVTNPTEVSNEFFINNMTTLGGIDRVEVLRGPQSGIYGSDSMAGVINIITPTGRGAPTSSAMVEGGSFGTGAAAFNSQGAVNRLFYGISASHIQTDGISMASRPPGNIEDDGYTNRTVLGTLGYSFIEDGDTVSELSLRLTGRYVDAEADTDASFGGPPEFFWQDSPHVTDSTESLLFGQLNMGFFEGVFVNKLTASSFVVDSRTELEGTMTDDSKGTNRELEYLGTVFAGRGGPWSLTANFGADRQVEEGEFRVNLEVGEDAETEITTDGIFAGLDLTLPGNWHVSVAGRRDDHELFGDVNTYRTAVAWQIPMESGFRFTKLRASYGSGFEAPSLFQLFADTMFTVGNPDLQPERSEMWDAGVHFAAGAWLVGEITYYDGYANDGIFSSFDLDTFKFKYDNIDSPVDLRGVETSLRFFPLPSFAIQLDYTWGESIIRDTGVELFERPKNIGVLYVDYGVTRSLNLGLTLTYRDEQFASFPSGYVMDEYLLLDLHGGYLITPSLTVYARIGNVTDEEYEERLGTGQPGTNGRLGLRFRF